MRGAHRCRWPGSPMPVDRLHSKAARPIHTLIPRDRAGRSHRRVAVMVTPELTISPPLGLWMVLKRARDLRLRWEHRDGCVYDSGRPMQPWLYQHLDVAMADSYVRFVGIVECGFASVRAVLTAGGAALLPLLELIHDEDVRTSRQRRVSAMTTAAEASSKVSSGGLG